MDDIKNTLKNQIEEKKRLEVENKKEELKYNEIVKINAEKFRKDHDNQIKINQEKILSYKDQLDRQITQKDKRKFYMDDKEKQFNKELIQKIYCEISTDK